MKKNPFSLMFGKPPEEVISRSMEMAAVESAFCADEPSQQVFMITGLRGAGKTVFMTEVAARMRQKDDWVVVECNPEKDLLESLLAKLTSNQELEKMIRLEGINLSFLGFGIDIKGRTPIKDVETALSAILESMKKKHQRLLITIDEAVNSSFIRVFASAFQIFVRQELPIFLIMTGLYENIYSLQNEKSLTFLYRAPKIELAPLNLRLIGKRYQELFRLDSSQAAEMARFTQGYSFAFQALGYLTWEKNGNYLAVLDEYKAILADYSYDKIWSELSENDRRLVTAMAQTDSARISDIRECLQIDNNHFNPYRKRLIKKGIVNGEQFGYLRFVLPFFREYVLEMTDL